MSAATPRPLRIPSAAPFQRPRVRNPESRVIGAAEAKTLFWLPALLGLTAVAPGGDIDPASIMLRCTIIGCVLGGYVGMVIKHMARRGKVPLAERVMDGISLWSVNAIVGGVGTYVAFEHFAWTVRAGSVLGFAFALATVGTTAAGAFIVRAKQKVRETAAAVGLPEQPNSDPDEST